MENGIISTQQTDIQNLVYAVRGKKVMLDSDLGKIYSIVTTRLNEQFTRVPSAAQKKVRTST